MRELLKASHLDGLRALVTELGGDFDALLEELSLPPLSDSDADAYISHRKLIEITNLAARRLRRPDIGLLWGPRSSPMMLGPLGVALLNAPTARRSIELLVRFLPKQNSVLRAALSPLDKAGLELFSLHHHMRRPPSLIHIMERNVGLVLGMLRQLAGETFKPAEIWLAHAQNAETQAYKRAFGVVPHFLASSSGIVLRRADLDLAVPGHRREVFDMALSYVERSTPLPHAENDPLATASAVLATNRSFALADVARVMGMHVRKLQRLLNEAGVTYSQLKDNVRRDHAERLLVNERRALIDIALELGFKDQAAFTRASRRWFGAPPSAARLKLAAGFDGRAKAAKRKRTVKKR